MGLGIGKIFGKLVSPVTDIISEVVVDKDKARELNVRVKELADKADERYHKEVMGQLEINKEEAKHSSIFVAGWRPFVGWTGGVGFAYMTVVQPVASWIAQVIFKYSGPFPELETGLLITVLGGILGLGTLRTYEKKEGVARTKLKEAS